MKMWDPLKESFADNKSTYISVFILGLIAIIFYLIAYSDYLAQEPVVESILAAVEDPSADSSSLRNTISAHISDAFQRDAVRQLLLNLSIAFAVAVIIIITVELYSRRRTRHQILKYQRAIREDVWKAVVRRLVPPAVQSEIEAILKADSTKKECRYTLTFVDPYPDLPEGRVILRREVRYVLKNASERRIDVPIRSLIHNEFDDLETVDHDGKPITVPRHMQFSIDGKNISLKEKGEGGCLERNGDGQLRNLKYSVKLQRSESVEVYLCGEEMLPEEDRNSYTQLKPMEGIELRIFNEARDTIEVTDVMLQHPNFEEFQRGPDGVYKYTGGVLPGQAIVVGWSRRG